MTETTVAPAVPISVVVVRFAGGDAIARALAALAPQVGQQRGEILVAHAGPVGPSSELSAAFPAVRWIQGEAEASPARLRALGVRASRGTLVACTEDHCTPVAEWCARIVAAHAVGAPAVIGGAIDKAPTTDGVAWATYLLDYARYMSPLDAGPSSYASDCNVSYPRAALEAVASTWDAEFHETTVHWALRDRGVDIRLDPTIVVRQHRDVVLGEYLRERREHGRIFALTRLDRASPAARLRFTLTALLLPPVIVLRVRRLVKQRGAMAAVPPSAWGPLVRAAIAWSAGELRGYVGGR